MVDFIGFLTERLNEDAAVAMTDLMAFLGKMLEWDEAWALDHLDRAQVNEAGEVSDPQRWLAEVAAKRRIIAEHESYGGYGEKCGTCYKEDDLAGDPWPCLTLRALVSVYQDHPQFQTEWSVS